MPLCFNSHLLVSRGRPSESTLTAHSSVTSAGHCDSQKTKQKKKKIKFFFFFSNTNFHVVRGPVASEIDFYRFRQDRPHVHNFVLTSGPAVAGPSPSSHERRSPESRSTPTRRDAGHESRGTPRPDKTKDDLRSSRDRERTRTKNPTESPKNGRSTGLCRGCRRRGLGRCPLPVFCENSPTFTFDV